MTNSALAPSGWKCGVRAVLAAVAVSILFGAPAASARVVVGIGVPLAVGPAYGYYGYGVGPWYYGPPPAYYTPPPAYYTPPPAYYYPPPAGTVAPQATPQTCREYQSTITIDGKPQRVHGTVCRQPDGTWRAVN